MPSGKEFQAILNRVRVGEAVERMLTAEGQSWYRRFRPRERLLLFGGGYIAQALCGLAADLDFAVSAADDRPEYADSARFPRAERVLCAGYAEAVSAFGVGAGDYAAVLTRGHLFDADCLRAILRGPFPRYVGVIGSRGRGAALLGQLEAEGFPRALLDRIHTPIGLDIHALTVPEIAVSIAAELIAVRRADLDRRNKSAILADEGFCEPVLAFLAEPSVLPRAVLTVCATDGSTPVKSGSMMAVDALGRTAGTIGGGSGEGELIAAARGFLREWAEARTDGCTRAGAEARTDGCTPAGAEARAEAQKDGDGKNDAKAAQGKRLVSVAMHSGPTEEGMACGGTMRVLIEVVEP